MLEQSVAEKKRAVVSSKTVDDVLLALNWWGRYQRVQFVLLMLPVLATVGHSMSVVFFGRDAEHRCAAKPNEFTNSSQWYGETDIDNNISVSTAFNNSFGSSYSVVNRTTTKYGQCKIRVFDSSGRQISSTRCLHGYQYSEPRDRTFVSEWDLVCEKEALSDFSQMIMAIGMTVGAFGFSFLSDRFGRKIMYMLCHMLLFLLSVATALAPNFPVFTTLKFFTGAAQQGTALVSFVMLAELLPTEHRALTSQVGIFMHPTSLLSLGLVAYLTREISWRYAQLVMSAFSIYIFIQWWITDESLRWLVANGRTKQAERNIRKAARQNKVDIRKAMKVFRQGEQPVFVPLASLPDSEKAEIENTSQELASKPKTSEKQEERISLFQALKSRTVIKITAICCYMWFADCATYYGLIMTSTSLVDDLYLGYTVNILVELPAAVTYVLLINRIGRLKCIYIFNTIGGLSLLVAVGLSTISAAETLPGRDIFIVIVSLLGKFGISLAFGTLWIYTSELFPTNIRNTCMGISSVAARTGAMVAPFSRTLGRHLPWAPGVIFACLCLLIPVLTMFLPETKGRELPQTIADMERDPNRRDTDAGKNTMDVNVSV